MQTKTQPAMQTSQFQWKNLPATSLQHDQQLILDWDRLSAERGDLAILASGAITSALRILGDGQERLLVALDGADVVAMLILCPDGKFRWKTFQPSQLPLGAWVAKQGISLPELGRSLLRGPLGICLVLSFTQIDPHVAPRTEDTRDSQHSDYIDTGWVDIEGSFETYWSARGKNLRQNMRKQRAKLLADGVQLTMRVLRDFDDMAPAIGQYGVLESAGWKAQKGTAIHLDNAQGRFYSELLQQASLRDEAVVYQYLFDDKVVAMNLCLLRNGTLVVLKTTYDESIQSYSPAFLLRESELQAFHQEGQVKRVEYFGRLMDWHTKLTSQKRTLYHLTLYRWPFVKKFAEARRLKAAADQATAASASTIATVAATATVAVPGARDPGKI